MIESQYVAQNEFELYGAMIKGLSSEDFALSSCRGFLFVQCKHSWNLNRSVETQAPEKCAQFFETHQNQGFLLVIGPSGSEVTFHGQEINVFCRYDGEHLNIYEFDDLNPNEEYQKFEKTELRQSLMFLKSGLRDD